MSMLILQVSGALFDYHGGAVFGYRSMSVAQEVALFLVIARRAIQLSKTKLDDFSHTFEVATMGKVFGPGLIRFQAYGTWMALEKLKVASA